MSEWTEERIEGIEKRFKVASDGLAEDDFWMENNPDEASFIIFTDLPAAMEYIRFLRALIREAIDDWYGDELGVVIVDRMDEQTK